MLRRLTFWIAIAAMMISFCQSITAQVPDSTRVAELEAEIKELRADVGKLDNNPKDNANGGAALFLFGVFCALWAQNTGRNSWLWFFLGIFFNVITVLVLLYKNSKERRVPRST